ncbi:iron chelate uptake ABC transporter family permease subunit [Vibrio splendidus]|jgi:iron complex transport system permease protein|uniref:Iron chelate uptake ABC transporter family permease subunit n=1 Tax=Vibrio splendidus TaxID=29497 RepID=A0A2N7EBS8_VIBSP|nr:iron chelate uptake ABC transporter family permease subunit [Vibrio splendidus]MCC4861297.1 iron chelate uptake ABC transporter family permease subunit [Vibrio splendidus]MCW4443966.1 iron chelate uptake ABC transporter family permease subunit [Vibrio splendidus]MDH5894848.1 iron chelate uptake ABC transporter family permease subunit [Vibrio splendidus]MDH5920769.1 iron chelate uptake ABC transporter family permease subunit [Vibrio splendidus]PMI73657.1 ABC transporter permease [Vibrio sple
MRDSVKIAILAIASLCMAAVFVGQGLTWDNYEFFLSLRLPKLLSIVLAAVAISASSLVFQTITNNRILTPSILGFDSLYMLVQTVLLFVFGSASFWVIDSIANFSMSVTVMILFSFALFHFYFKSKRNNVFTLLLIGIVCGSVFSSLANFLAMLIDPNEFAVLQNVMFASFNNVKGELVYLSLIPLGLSLLGLWLLAPKLDVLWLGVDNATSLGVNTKRLTQITLVIVSVMVAVSTALVGPVLFFGLITVSLARQIFKSYQHRVLIIASSLLAVVLLVSGQWFIEKVMAFETTVSVIINLVGGLYFMFLLLRTRIQ